MMKQPLDVLLIRVGLVSLALEFAIANILYFNAMQELKSHPFGGFVSAFMPSWGSIMIHMPTGGNLFCTLLAAAGVLSIGAGFALRHKGQGSYGRPAGGALYPSATTPAGQAPGRAPRLLCTQGEYANATIPLDPSGVVMGRDAASCGLVLNSSQISRVHAKVSFNPASEQFVLQDLGSTNGVFVGPTRITGTVTLKSGQSFRLGQDAVSFTVLA